MALVDYGYEQRQELSARENMSCRIPAVRGAVAGFGVLLLFILGVLSGCSPEDEGAGGASEITTRPGTTAQSGTTVQPGTTVRPAGGDEGAEQPARANVAEVAASGIDGSSIRAHLRYLTGVSPAPLESGEVTIAERGSAEGRRAAAEYMELSFEEAGVPARILEFGLDGRRGYNVEATVRGTEGGKHLWVSALGSARYVEGVVGDIIEQEGEGAIIGNLNIDMVGYDGREIEAVMGTCNRAGSIDDALVRASELISSPIDLTDVCLGRSDHQNFWDAGFPAVVFSDGSMYDGYPWYHEPGDTVDKLDISYLRSMIRLAAAATALLAAPEGQRS
jgi:hypothetical protein